MSIWLNQHKNQIMIANGGLILISLAGYGFKLTSIAQLSMLIAGVIGLLPIISTAISALRVKVVSIDLLVSIAMIGALLIGEYHEAAIVAFLFLIGEWLEKITLKKTRSAIKQLTDLAPKTAILLTDGQEVEVDVDEVEVGDHVIVRTGQQIPVDGTVVDGSALVNQASVTGESKLVSKTLDTEVYSGTVVDNGDLEVLATQVGEDSTFGKIIELIEEAEDSKSKQQTFIDKFATYYTPLVLVLGVIVGFITKDLNLAITILVLGCPGALVIGIPISNVAGIGNGAKNQILVKGNNVMDALHQIDTFVFDKTGTLTQGNAQVKVVEKFNDQALQAFMYAASLENHLKHPLGEAIIKRFGDASMDYQVTQSDVIKGQGVVGKVDGHELIVGNQQLMLNSHIQLSTANLATINRIQDQGLSTVIVAVNQQLAGILGIGDVLRTDAVSALNELRNLGAQKLVMLTGDDQKVADQIAKELNLDAVYANLMPQDKEQLISKFQANHQRVAFVGDGINDSPSLVKADVGIAIGSGTDVAIESADIVLMSSKLSSLVHAYGLSKANMKNMTENIVLAIATVVLLLVGLIFNKVNMASGMFIHEISILLVILNGMRLLKYHPKLDDDQGKTAMDKLKLNQKLEE